MPVTPTIEVDDTLKERSSHGSFELPIETYTDNCEIFHSLYNHWHDEMELIYIESGSGLVRLNKEILRVKAGDLIIVNRGVLHGIKTVTPPIASVPNPTGTTPLYTSILSAKFTGILFKPKELPTPS